MLSAWQRGVREYAEELLGQARSDGIKGRPTAKQLLNGAANWREYSFGGCALIYNGDICARLCTPSEQRKRQNGQLPPNSRETWLDVQARALYQACALILNGEYTDDALDAITENKKFPQHQYRAVVGFIDHSTKIAYFVAEYRAREWAERARAIAGDRFAGYQIQRRANDTYIIKEDKR